MPGFSDRLSAMKAAQESADAKREADRARREKLDEVTRRREAVGAEFEVAEEVAKEATEAVNQAEAFMAEQGENLDPGAKKEIDAIKAEAAEIMQKYRALKAELAQIDAELAELNAEEPSAPETAEETTESVIAEEAPAETESTGENPVSEEVETASEKSESDEKSNESDEESVETLNLEELEEYQTKLKSMRMKINQERGSIIGNPKYRELVTRLNKQFSALKETNPEAAEKFSKEVYEKYSDVKRLKDLADEMKEVDEKLEGIERKKAGIGIDAALEAMSNMHPPENPTERFSFDYSRELSEQFREIEKSLQVLSQGEHAENFEPIAKKVANEMKKKIIEFTKSSKDVAGFNPARRGAGATMTETLSLLDEISPGSAEDLASIVLDGVTEEFKDKSPDEIREGLYYMPDVEPIYRALGPIFRKLSRGESLSENAKASLKKVLPILRASDNSTEMGANNMSRFLTDERITGYAGAGDNEKDFLDKLRSELEKIENE